MSDYTDKIDELAGVPAVVADPRRMQINTGELAKTALEMGPDGVESLTQVLALAERERDYQAHRAYDDAMRTVQSEAPRIYKDGENLHNKSRYAKLESVDRHLRPLYTREGFRITFTTAPCEQQGWITHIATVTHTGGHVEKIAMPLPIDNLGPGGKATKTEMHGVGSALSYAQRRLTMMAFGAVATGEDDDGQAAAHPEPPECVSQEQADTLRQHVLELFVEPGKFLALYSTDTFAGVPAMAYADAMQRISARREWLEAHPDKAEELAAQIAKRDQR